MKLDNKPYEEKMQKTITVYEGQLDTVRAGRANTAVLNGIDVEYYGTPTAINQMAEVKVTDARTIAITPWDVTTVKRYESIHSQYPSGRYRQGKGAKKERRHDRGRAKAV